MTDVIHLILNRQEALDVEALWAPEERSRALDYTVIENIRRRLAKAMKREGNRWTPGRLPACTSQHTGPCRPYTEERSKTLTWRCPACRRLYCNQEGGSDSPVCDTCWADRKKRRAHKWKASR